ncbi:MAG: LysM peptidoglycan-binding domain-containing protein [Flavobacteriales bacterium]|jgi:nucleoid-associated protein YgaU|nr:LysM peptidoglycan-binding domain-containing protein [Flavobacteriales bacterium]
MAIAEGQLGKMTIIFYPKASLPGVGVPFTPMYNPSSLTVNHNVVHEDKPLSGAGDISKKFIRTSPKTVSVDLFFDGTSASPSNLIGTGVDIGLLTPGLNAVDLQIQAFLKLGYGIDSDEHQPFYMMLVWGTFVMTGVLKTANVTYSMFDNAGRPLRAKMSISVDEYVELDLWKKILKKKSSDVSKSITVVAGDTLPLLCFRQYGDSSLYPKIAEVNGLTNYRNLKPGMELLFPPLTTLPE